MTHLWKLCQWLVVTKVYTTVMQTVGHTEHYVRPQVSNEIYTRLFLQGTFAFFFAASPSFEITPIDE